MKANPNNSLKNLECNKQNSRSKILSTCDYVCCAFLAIALSASPYYLTQGYCSLTLALVLSILAVFVTLIFITYLIRKFFSYKRLQKSNFSHVKVCVFVEKLLHCKHPILAIAAIILACWAIPIIFLYPGTCINDTWGQLYQYITFLSHDESNTLHALNDYHPIFDTFAPGSAVYTFFTIISTCAAYILLSTSRVRNLCFTCRSKSSLTLLMNSSVSSSS